MHCDNIISTPGATALLNQDILNIPFITIDATVFSEITYNLFIEKCVRKKQNAKEKICIGYDTLFVH